MDDKFQIKFTFKSSFFGQYIKKIAQMLQHST
jgi:hypothetical protein